MATKNQKDKIIGVTEIKIRAKLSKYLTKKVKNMPGRIEDVSEVSPGRKIEEI